MHFGARNFTFALKGSLFIVVVVTLVNVITTTLFPISGWIIAIIAILLLDLVTIIHYHSIKNFNKGYEFHQKKEYDLAIDCYSKTLKLNPLFAAAYANRGAALAEKREYELAINDYNKAIKLKPKRVNTYLNRGLAYIETQRYDLATADFDMVIKLAPQDADAYFNMGAAYELQNHKEDAIGIYRALIKNLSDDMENVKKAQAKIRTLGAIYE